MKKLKLESDLLKVSTPYEIMPGDTVKNINPDCTHYKSTGTVLYVHDNGDITYVVNNQGATYRAGDQLTKSANQIMKVLTHTPMPGYGSFTNESLDECVIAKIDVDGKRLLAKNRDRAYKAPVEIIHELIDGVEVVYIHDALTDWSEGLNEFGIGLVNASLMVDFDEKEGKLAKEKEDKGKKVNPSFDGLKIRTALSKKKLSEAIRSIVTFKGEDKTDVGVKGMTIVSNPKYTFLIEMTSKHLPVINRINNGETVVRTNHGIAYPDTGYTSGVKRTSSESRMAIAKEKLSNVTEPGDVLSTLSAQYTQDNFLNPYRRQNKHNMVTTSQVMFNLSDLELHLKWDIDFSEYKGYINKLPKNYNPKIKVFVGKTD